MATRRVPADGNNGTIVPPVLEGSHQQAGPSVQILPDDDPNAKKKKEKKNKPKATKLRQQKLPAWQPILTARTVIPGIFVIGIVFLPIGVALFMASQGVREMVINYTACEACRNGECKSAHDHLDDAKDTLNTRPLPTDIKCNVDFNLTENLEGDVYFYYELTNFYQNHRRYVKSRSDRQLTGDIDQVGDCEPFATITVGGMTKYYAPCGAVANSMFNDTFSLDYMPSPTEAVTVPFTHKGVVWSVDREKKFKNPTYPNRSLCDTFAKRNAIRPPNWQVDPCKLDTTDPSNNGFQNTDFIIWMRTAALPDFRKLYRILVRDGNAAFKGGLPKGRYRLSIQYRYPVKSFGGKKSFVISTTSWAGGKNSFLGIAYMVVGSFCILLGAVFLIVHLKFGNSLSDISNVRTN